MARKSKKEKPSTIADPKALLKDLTKKKPVGESAVPKLKANKEKGTLDLEENEASQLLGAEQIEGDLGLRQNALSQMEEFLQDTEGLVPDILKGTSLTQEDLHAVEAPVEEAADPNAPTGNIWQDSMIFFRQLGRAYNLRYEMWEQQYTIILKILQKIWKTNSTNTTNLLKSLDNLERRLLQGLAQFEVKRDEVQRYAETDFKKISENLKKTLNLLALQLKAFKLGDIVGEMYDIYAV